MRTNVEKYRQKTGPWATKEGDTHGLFFVKSKDIVLKVLSSPFDDEYQHVSVSLPNRCPTWNEMCLIKKLFYGEDVTVVQYHPKKEFYVNNHPYVLHLWAKRDEEFELPPSILVGLK